MKCVIWNKGQTRTGTATVTLDKDGAILVFKGVPAQSAPTAVKNTLMKTLRRVCSNRRRAAQSGIQVKSVSTPRLEDNRLTF